MHLNPDCVRDILLQIEQYTTFSKSYSCNISNSQNSFPKYDWETILYHVKQCELSNLIYDVHFYGTPTSFNVKDLTPNGHEFLANVRQDTIWQKVISRAQQIGSISLPVLQQIAATYFQNKI